jgi:Zn-dependent protease with chaperone function/Zn-finger nucleic acid-binding protein
LDCPHCRKPTLAETLTKSGVLVDVCKQCRGVWLDRGEVFLFSRRPRALENAIAASRTSGQHSDRSCPRCGVAMQEGPFLQPELRVDQCPSCEGYWFDAGELQQAIAVDRESFQLETEDVGFEPEPGAVDDRAHRRLQDMASGLLPLPNLFIRSAGVIALLYAMLGLVLIALVQFCVISASLSVAIGATIVVLQFVFGPWIMDLCLNWLYKASWVQLHDLPSHLAEFVKRVAAEQDMKVPSFCLIHDGAPNAFTYGHTPNNMRIAITQGILDLLEPEEVEGVVAHEIGHGKNWDMLLMTVVQLVPLLLFYAYRICLQSRGDKKGNGGGYQVAIGIGAYALYIASEYVVLWFSRCREYYADRFAGNVTGKPNALASALVKIGYGLAARGGQPAEEETAEAKGKKPKKKEAASPMLDAVGAMGIFDRKAAVAMVATSAGMGVGSATGSLSKENLKSAMQWDLWNPWATFYELNSTHPLIAHRLQYLSDQSASMGQDPFVVFDRRKPESYWDDFAFDLAIMFLPALLMVVGLGLAGALGFFTLARGAQPGLRALSLLGLPVLGLGIGSLLKTWWTYRGDYFAPLNVSGLLHKVKVSGVRPVPARVRGTVIGKGVPGLIWSEDFVMRDSSGILFLDYRQPLRIWDWLFGLLRAGTFTGKTVDAIGWFRRSPVPYLELKAITVDGVTRNCYARHMKYVWAGILSIAGVGLIVAGLTA